MGWYQEFLGDSDMPTKIYHLCPQDDWEKRPNKLTYFAAGFEKDQVVRCTHEIGRLVETANCFYQASSPPHVPWLCLELDTFCLRMNGIECQMVTSEMHATLKCPHVYGGIPQEAVTHVWQVQRDPSTGAFLVVQGLTDTCSLTGRKIKTTTTSTESSPTSATTTASF
ncbi:hypothetical protein ACA910_015004 [Epithemia clementina (nom. ined.)]